jgi:predicted DNA-binding protein with PD1-like motif
LRTEIVPREMMTLRHPGTPATARALATPARCGETFTCAVEQGRDLFTTVEAAAAQDGASTAFFTIVGGEVESLTIMTGGTGIAPAPVGFRGPHEIAAPVRFVSGTGICGIDEAGNRFCHCHAVFADRQGRLVGGHLIFGATRAGNMGIVVAIHPVRGAAFQRALDRETGFSIFYPVVS